MNTPQEIRAFLAKLSQEQKVALFEELRVHVDVHRFERTLNAKAEVILEALARASDLTIRGVRGIVGEATFALEILPKLKNWRDITPPGNHSFDYLVSDSAGKVSLQVKMQRRLKQLPWIRNGMAVVEVQRTRTGELDGQATRPYSFGTFDILAVCMEPSTGRWNSFLYIPEKWLLCRKENQELIETLQPVPLNPDAIWTDDFEVSVRRFRSNLPRPESTGSGSIVTGDDGLLLIQE